MQLEDRWRNPERWVVRRRACGMTMCSAALDRRRDRRMGLGTLGPGPTRHQCQPAGPDSAGPARWFHEHLGITMTAADHNDPRWQQQAGTMAFAPFPPQPALSTCA
jgi:hypothetical protein